MSPGTLLAAGLAAAAAMLLVPPTARLTGGPPGYPRGWLPGLLVVPVLLAVVLPGRAVAGALVGTVAAGGLLVLVRQRRTRRAAAAARARVLDSCQLLSAELTAGRPPGLALERAAAEWPALDPVASAYRLGGEVPVALRRLADQPGHADLALVAAAWQVAHSSGGGLSVALRRVAAGIRAGQATQRVVQAELASARATARLMAGLPVLALVMGGGLGGDPVGFLLTTPVGLACLSGGVLLQLAGLGWIEAIAGSVDEA